MSEKPNESFTVVDSGFENGVRWVTAESPLGSINGYVQLSEDHPWCGKTYDEIDVVVHGGLTYSENGWIGFDTLHDGDHWPGMTDHLHFCREGSCTCIQWTSNLVVDETVSLARQVKKAWKEAGCSG